MSGLVNNISNWKESFLRRIVRYFSKKPYVYVSGGGKIINEGKFLDYCSLIADDNSEIVIEKGASLINCRIVANKNSKIRIGASCTITNSIISATNGKVEIGEVSVVGSTQNHPTRIIVNDSLFSSGSNCKLFLDSAIVRFGGILNIGNYVGIGYFGDIRCDENVEIADYGLISYDVNIYDTYVHSADSGQRRDWITEQFPLGLVDPVKPKTQKVVIESDVWLGKNVSILKGCIIKKGSTVALGVTLSNYQGEVKETFVSEPPRVL